MASGSTVVAQRCVNEPLWLRETASPDPVAKMLGFGSAPGTAVRGLGRGNSLGGSPQPLQSGKGEQMMDDASTDPAALHQGTADAASLPILNIFQTPIGASMMQPQRCRIAHLQPPDVTGYLLFQQGTDV